MTGATAASALWAVVAALSMLATRAAAQVAVERGSPSWSTRSDLPGVDLNVLDPDRRDLALGLLRELSCTCGCGMKLAQCRIQDTKCPISPGLARTVVELVGDGRTAVAVRDHMAGLPPPPRRILRPLGDSLDFKVEGAPGEGPPDAGLILIFLYDLESPYSRAWWPVLRAMLDQFGGAIRINFHPVPAKLDHRARLASAAVFAADQQHQFRPMYTKVNEHIGPVLRADVSSWARELALELDEFENDLDRWLEQEAPAAHREAVLGAGIHGVPSLLINGKLYKGACDPRVLEAVIQAELEGRSVKFFLEDESQTLFE